MSKLVQYGTALAAAACLLGTSAWAEQSTPVDCTAAQAVYRNDDTAETQRTILSFAADPEWHFPVIRAAGHDDNGREEWTLDLQYDVGNHPSISVDIVGIRDSETFNRLELIFIDRDGSGTFVRDMDDPAPWLIILAGMGSARMLDRGDHFLEEAAGTDRRFYLDNGPYKLVSCND